MRTPDVLLTIRDEVFGGDFDRLAKCYYQTLSDLRSKVDFDIIGHFDLITKFSERLGIRETKKYIDAATDAIDVLVKYDKPFEINTGAITRGYRTSPYPSETLLRYLLVKGGKIVITGDCHSKDHLLENREAAYAVARKVGFKSECLLTKDGWVEQSIID